MILSMWKNFWSFLWVESLLCALSSFFTSTRTLSTSIVTRSEGNGSLCLFSGWSSFPTLGPICSLFCYLRIRGPHFCRFPFCFCTLWFVGPSKISKIISVQLRPLWWLFWFWVSESFWLTSRNLRTTFSRTFTFCPFCSFCWLWVRWHLFCCFTNSFIIVSFTRKWRKTKRIK